MLKTVMDEISEVKFRRKNPEGWETVSPRQLKTTHILHKARYHTKQLLACLLELNHRNIDVCQSLETIHSKVGYKNCYIKPYDSNKLKLFLSIDRKQEVE